MIGQDGKMSFIRQNVYVRVPTYRLVRVGKEFVKSEINDVNLHNTSCDTLTKEINGSDFLEDDMTGNETKQSAESNQQQDELREQVVHPAKDTTASSGSNLQSSSQKFIKKKITLPKNSQEILYRPKVSDTWIQSTVFSRGGKATLIYLNIHDKGEDQLKVFSLTEILVNGSQSKKQSVLL